MQNIGCLDLLQAIAAALSSWVQQSCFVQKIVFHSGLSNLSAASFSMFPEP